MRGHDLSQNLNGRAAFFNAYWGPGLMIHYAKPNSPIASSGADHWDRLNADYLKRMLLKRPERLGLQVAAQSREERPLALPA